MISTNEKSLLASLDAQEIYDHNAAIAKFDRRSGRPGERQSIDVMTDILTKAGVKVSRRSAHSYSENGSWTLVESIDDLKKGDLLFFKSDSSDRVNHTAIYIGGSRFIHASASKGQVVQSSFSSYWERNFVCGRRVFH